MAIDEENDRGWRESLRSSNKFSSSYPVTSVHNTSPTDLPAFITLWSALDSIKWRYPTQGPGDIEKERQVTPDFARGVSFAISRYRSSEGDDQLRKSLTGRVESTVALKRTNVVLDSQGNLDIRGRMMTIIRELRVLSHPPIRIDQNIVDLLGLAWESDPNVSEESPRMWPVLITSFAPLGNLSDILRKGLLKNEEIPKKRLCQEIALGLMKLHECGIVHGDVKCENVLIFQQDGAVIAKIADFGNSILISEASNFCQLPGGTPPWNAPEWQDNLKKEHLHLTDVYSYGLLVWRVILNDREVFEEQPFLFTYESCLLDASEPYILVNGLESFKASNKLLQLILERCDTEPGAIDFAKSLQNESSGLSKLFARTLSATPTERNLREASDIFGVYVNQLSDDLLDVGVEENQFQAAREAFLLLQRQDNSSPHNLRELEDQYDLSRSLLGIIKILSELAKSSESESLGLADNIREARDKVARVGQAPIELMLDVFDLEISIDLELVDSLEYRVQQALLESLNEIAIDELSPLHRRSRSNLYAGIFHIQATGTEYAPQKGFEMLCKAARLGDIAAQAIFNRVHSAFKMNDLEQYPIKEWLVAGTERGSFVASEDLRVLFPDLHQAALFRFRTQFCGVGRELFNHQEVLSKFSLQKGAELRVQLKQGCAREKLNSRGDLLIHYVAMCGYTEAIDIILDEFPLYLEATNEYDDTPLLCACRSGNIGVFRTLMQRNAKTDAVNIFQETPLHWLIAFDDSDIEEVASALIEKSPKLVNHISDKDRTFYNHIWNSLVEGTPLHRAVAVNRPRVIQLLLKLGADPLHGGGPIRNLVAYGPTKTSPLMLAIMLHMAEIIELILKTLEDDLAKWLNPPSTVMKFREDEMPSFNDVTKMLQQPEFYDTWKAHQTHSLLYFAVAPDRLLFRIIIHGSRMSANLKSTINSLLKTNVNEEVVDAGSRTVLVAAVEKGDFGVTDFLLSKQTSRYIDHPASPRGIRPLHISILLGHYQVSSLLMSHKANILNPWLEEDGTLWTALHACAMAATHGLRTAKEILAIHLLKAFAKGSEPVFSLAVSNRSFELATILLEAGADQNELIFPPGDKDRGLTTLGKVLTQNLKYCLPAIKYLLEPPHSFGSAAFIVEPKGSANALHLAIYMNGDTDDNDFNDLLSYLLEKFPGPIHVDHTDENGLTALHFSVIVGNMLAVKLLLKAGADVNAMTNFLGQPVNLTPLDLARIYASMELLSDLEIRGDINATKWKKTKSAIVDVLENAGGLASNDSRMKAIHGWNWRQKIIRRVLECHRPWLPLRKLNKWDRAFFKEQERRRQASYTLVDARGLG